MLSVEEKSPEKNAAVPRLNEISTKAARDFSRNFKNASDPKWFKAKEGFVVYFRKDGVDSRAFYTKKGQYEGVILSYYEDKLAPKIRHLVKSVYYDFNICHVYELQNEDMTAYVVKLLGKTSCKTVSIVNGEMNVIEELQKQ